VRISSNVTLRDFVIEVRADEPNTQTVSNRGVSVYGIYANNAQNFILSRLLIKTGNASDGGNGTAGAPGAGIHRNS
jgi:hypothetical protein